MKPGRGVHAFVEIGLLRVHMAVEVKDAEFASFEFCATPRTVGKPREWSPPSTTGNAPLA